MKILRIGFNILLLGLFGVLVVAPVYFVAELKNGASTAVLGINTTQLFQKQSLPDPRVWVKNLTANFDTTTDFITYSVRSGERSRLPLFTLENVTKSPIIISAETPDTIFGTEKRQRIYLLFCGKIEACESKLFYDSVGSKQPSAVFQLQPAEERSIELLVESYGTNVVEKYSASFELPLFFRAL